MREPLTLAVAQPRSVLHDVAGNVARHAAAVVAARAGVVIFPELSLTGYGLDATAVDIDDPVLEPIVDACRRSGSVALVGAPTPVPNGGRRISMVRVDGHGVGVAYSKLCLSDDEARRFEPGERPAVATVGGWRLGLAICKDTGVPDHARRTAKVGIDAYVAGVCEMRRDRAIVLRRSARVTAEHRVWVAIASFAGPTGGGFDRTAGCSVIRRPDGSIADVVDAEPGRIARATLRRP